MREAYRLKVSLPGLGSGEGMKHGYKGKAFCDVPERAIR